MGPGERRATVLTEGGPRLLGRLVTDDLLDEVFLTVSPVLAGRAETSRPGLVAAQELLPARATEQAELISVCHRRSYLCLPVVRLNGKVARACGGARGSGDAGRQAGRQRGDRRSLSKDQRLVAAVRGVAHPDV